MRLALIGTGNVAWHLAHACTAAGHELIAVASRSTSSGEEFVKPFSTTRSIAITELKHTSVDLIIIAVPDAALEEVVAILRVQPNTVVAHTSGSQPLAILNTIPNAVTGVFYPVQTFTKYIPINFIEVPLLIESQSQKAEKLLYQFASSLSRNVQIKDSAARRQLHLAAVFACNFTNHLLGISQAVLQEAGLPADLLHSLIQETVLKAEKAPPFTVQTGPAIRHDNNVIQGHIHMLESHPSWQKLYDQLTKSIQEQKTKS
jgi:predicted short-subunit dehydrogenase-like oxidoreductase (DUF2520 family)